MVNDKFITFEGTSCTDKNEIVEQFNKYFTNIGSSLNSKLPKTGEDPTHHIKHNTASVFGAPTDPTVPASVTVQGWGSGSYLDCVSDASLEPPAIAVYNPDVLGVYLVFIIPHMMANRG